MLFWPGWRLIKESVGIAVKEREDLQQFEDFLQDYRDFLTQVVEEQNEKLAILLTHDIDGIGQNVTRQQAINLEMKDYEYNRMQLQKAVGLGDKTLGEIVELLQGPQQQRFRQYHRDLQQAVEQIRFLNSKAMQMVETSLQVLDMAYPEARGYNEDGRQICASAVAANGILDSKI